MKLDLHYVDPRLVDVYDLEYSRGADTDFYVLAAISRSRAEILRVERGRAGTVRPLFNKSIHPTVG